MTNEEAIECVQDLAELDYWRRFHSQDGLASYHSKKIAHIRDAAKQKVLDKIRSAREEGDGRPGG